MEDIVVSGATAYITFADSGGMTILIVLVMKVILLEGFALLPPLMQRKKSVPESLCLGGVVDAIGKIFLLSNVKF